MSVKSGALSDSPVVLHSLSFESLTLVFGRIVTSENEVSRALHKESGEKGFTLSVVTLVASSKEECRPRLKADGHMPSLFLLVPPG